VEAWPDAGHLDRGEEVQPVSVSTDGSRRKAFRAFVSFVVLLAFIVLAVTGLVMYAWRAIGSREFLGLTRGAWNAVHTSISFLSILAAAAHVYLNWRVLVSYVKRRTSAARSYLRECVVALGLVVAVIAGTLLGIPPFNHIAPTERPRRPPIEAPMGAPAATPDVPAGPDGPR
jgi:hypothetical protein